MKIHMWNVGRDKWEGTIDCKFPGDPGIDVVKEAKKHLASRGIDICDPQDGEPGLIFAGIQSVGKWEIINEASS